MYHIFIFWLLGAISLGIIFIAKKTLKIDWLSLLSAFLYGVIVALIINGFIYSIGKEMKIDLYFFELRILGQNALEHFESMYSQYTNEVLMKYSLFVVLGSIILPAILEELWKLGAMRIFLHRSTFSIPTVRQYIVLLGIIALWFSVFENIIYLRYYLDLGYDGISLLRITILRIIMSTSSHILFSGVIAYFFARYTFGKYDLLDHKGFVGQNPTVSILKLIHIFSIRIYTSIHSFRLLLIWMTLGIWWHICYNSLISLWQPFFALCFLIVSWGIFYFWILCDTSLDTELWILEDKILLLKEKKIIQEREKKLFGTSEK